VAEAAQHPRRLHAEAWVVRRQEQVLLLADMAERNRRECSILRLSAAIVQRQPSSTEHHSAINPLSSSIETAAKAMITAPATTATATAS
jgi:hypothetical protein